jgi:hypothetical protein
MPKQKTSPWVWVAVGCGAALVLGVLAVGGLGYFGVRRLQQFEKDMEDPAKRAAKVQSLLGYQEVPEGYYPLVGFSVPFFFDMAMLTDVPPPADGSLDDHRGFDERGFIYMKMLALGHKQQELEDYFAGRTDDAEALDQAGIDLPRGEVLARGSFALGETEVGWMSQRGEVGFRGQGGDGLTTTFLIRCPDDKRTRMGFWFRPEAAPPGVVEEPGEAPAAGTPAEPEQGAGTASGAEDEEAMRRFLSHFDLCR